MEGQEKMKKTEIQCLCGAIKVQIKGDPVEQFYCHCDDCQAASGGPYGATGQGRPAPLLKLACEIRRFR
jgi:hypothetical protein